MFHVPEVKLSSGAHTSPEAGMCFMEMVAWFEGEKHSDKPECACPVLGKYGIVLNDRMPDDVRDQLLKPLVPLIAGTRDKIAEIKRGEFLAMWAVNKVLPVILREKEFDDLAERCASARDLNEARDAAHAAYASADAAAYAARAAAHAAYTANAAAYAARAAARAAYAANASANAARAAARAANASAYAAYAFANAADAAARAAYAAANASAYAVYAAAHAEKVWNIAVEGLKQAIFIGRHDGFSAVNFEERHAALRELVAA